MKCSYPRYEYQSISSLKSLAKALDVPVNVLTETAKNSDQYYIQNKPIEKKGKTRITYSVSEPLKSLHEIIKTNIFQKVLFPSYLQGAIKSDEITSRDYIYDAMIHSKHRFFISEDISNFFPSITYLEVYKLWLYFFKFTKPVAELLARITTYNGIVPQGSKTSSYIANLIFWQREGDLVKQLKTQGITYTRFVDDITLSSNHYIPKPEVSKIISSIYGMMLRHGVKPNRSKHFIGSCKNNIQIHNINVGGKRPSLGKKKLNEIRMSVYNCIKKAHQHGTTGAAYLKQYT